MTRFFAAIAVGTCGGALVVLAAALTGWSWESPDATVDQALLVVGMVTMIGGRA
jgi:hypothetical protein